MSKKISFKEALMIGIGGMFGVAIYVFPGITAAKSDGFDIFAWLIAGLLMITVGLIYTELSSAFPSVVGGPSVYPFLVFGKKEYSRFLSFLTGIGFYVGWTIAIVICAISATYYLSYIYQPFGYYSTMFSILIIIIAGFLTILGIKPSGRVNYFMTIALIILVLAFSIGALKFGNVSYLKPSAQFDFRNFLSSIALSIAAYGAWVGIPSIYAEVENPGKNVPRAVSFSILLTITIYVLFIISLHLVVPYEAFLNDPNIIYSPYAYAASLMPYKQFFTYIISVSSFLAIFTTVLVGLVSLSRAIFAMSSIKLIPDVISKFDNTRGKFALSTLIAMIPSVVLALFPGLFYKMIVIGTVVGTNIPYLVNVTSYLAYKRKTSTRTNAEFSLKLGIPIALLSFSVIAITSINLSTDELFASIIALFVLTILYIGIYSLSRIYRNNQ